MRRRLNALVTVAAVATTTPLTGAGLILAFGSARTIAVLPDRRRAYVADHLDGPVVVFDTTTAKIASRITGVPDARLAQADPAGTHLYVSTGTNLAMIDTATATVTATTGCATPTSLAMSRTVRRLPLATT